jgi:hypothetical protein
MTRTQLEWSLLELKVQTHLTDPTSESANCAASPDRASDPTGSSIIPKFPPPLRVIGRLADTGSASDTTGTPGPPPISWQIHATIPLHIQVAPATLLILL